MRPERTRRPRDPRPGSQHDQHEHHRDRPPEPTARPRLAGLPGHNGSLPLAGLPATGNGSAHDGDCDCCVEIDIFAPAGSRC